MTSVPNVVIRNFGTVHRSWPLTNPILTAAAGSFTLSGQSATLTKSSGAANYSWSTTVSGARKSAASGYIAPLAFVQGGTQRLCGVFYTTTSGTVDLYVERVLGETGSISTTITTFAATNAVAGTNYTDLGAGTTISYTDGEVGYKKVSVTLGTAPTGFCIIGLQFSNYNSDGTGTARHHYCYIWYQGTGYVSGAKYLNSLGTGIDSNGDTSGSGASGSPWRSLKYAAAQMGNSGGVLYVKNTGGSYKEIATGSDVNGAGILANQCTVSSPLIIVSDPANSAQPVFDNGVVGGGGSNQYDSNAAGICYGNVSSAIWFVDLKVLHGKITNQPTYAGGSYSTHSSEWSGNHVIWRCTTQYNAVNASNSSNIRLDSCYDCIIDNCKASESYAHEAGGGSNPWTSVSLNLESNIQFFHSFGMRVVGCTLDVGQFGVMQKEANDEGRFSVDILGCLAKRLKDGAYYAQANGSSPYTQQMLVRYSVFDFNTDDAATGLTPSLCYVPMAGTTPQSNHLDVYNCVVRKGSLIAFDNINHVRVWNNVSDLSGLQISVGSDSSPTVGKLEYANYNYYYNGTALWRLHYGGGTVSYNSFAAWKAASDTQLDNAPDPNSISTSTAPSYTNAAGFDYTWTNTSGFNSRAIGVGSFAVGTDW